MIRLISSLQYVIIGIIMNIKLWKLDSNDWITHRRNNSSNPTTPIDMLNTEMMLTPTDRQELEGFSLSPLKKKESMMTDADKLKMPKNPSNIKSQQAQKKIRDRQQSRKSRGLASKTKIKLHELIKMTEKELQQKQLQLSKVNSELEVMKDLSLQRKKHKEDIANNEQMLKFKEEQLTNLQTSHQSVLQGIKGDIVRQKELKKKNETKIVAQQVLIQQLRSKINKKNNMMHYHEQLIAEKQRLQKCLQEIKLAEAEKLAMRSDAIRESIEKLIEIKKGEVEKECQDKVAIIREIVRKKKPESFKQFQRMLEGEGIRPYYDYYTYSQLKKVPELNFKVNKEAQKIMELLDLEVRPNIPEIEETVLEPKELADLKQELRQVQELRRMREAEMVQREYQIKQLKKTKKQLGESLGEVKKKKEMK